VAGRVDDVGEQHGQHRPLPAAAPAGQELLDLPHQRVGVAGRRHVVDPGQLDQPRAGQVLAEIAGVAHVDEPVVGPMHHERWDVDLGQQVADVVLGLVGDHSLEGARAQRRALQPAQPAADPRVVGQRLGDQVEVRAGAPVLQQPGEALLALLRIGGPVVVGGGQRAHDRRVEDERVAPLGVYRGELERQRGSAGVAVDDGAVGAQRVEHGGDVLGLVLEREALGERVGESRAAAIDQDHAREVGHPLEEAREPRFLQDDLDVAEQTAEEEQVRPVTSQHAIGDRRVTTTRVCDLALCRVVDLTFHGIPD
jgi:hypothetical protein